MISTTDSINKQMIVIEEKKSAYKKLIAVEDPTTGKRVVSQVSHDGGKTFENVYDAMKYLNQQQKDVAAQELMQEHKARAEFGKYVRNLVSSLEAVDANHNVELLVYCLNENGNQITGTEAVIAVQKYFEQYVPDVMQFSLFKFIRDAVAPGRRWIHPSKVKGYRTEEDDEPTKTRRLAIHRFQCLVVVTSMLKVPGIHKVKLDLMVKSKNKRSISIDDPDSDLDSIETPRPRSSQGEGVGGAGERKGGWSFRKKDVC